MRLRLSPQGVTPGILGRGVPPGFPVKSKPGFKTWHLSKYDMIT